MKTAVSISDSAKKAKYNQRDGAGEGNRTLVFSLEGCCSTIELHPPTPGRLRRGEPALELAARHCAHCWLAFQAVAPAGSEGWWRGLDSNQCTHKRADLQSAG